MCYNIVNRQNCCCSRIFWKLGIKKNGSIQLNAFPTTVTEDLRIYYIIEGRFEWRINHQPYIFYPGDVAADIARHALWQRQWGAGDRFLYLGPAGVYKSWRAGISRPANGAGFLTAKAAAIGKILSLNSTPVLSRFNEAGKILKCIHAELFGQ